MSKLRSQSWYGRLDRDGFSHRSWMKNQGWPQDVFGRPVIGICNTWSELNPCNAHFRELAEWVKRGVWESGGFPLEFPVMSLAESQLRPTAMLFRNLASMDVEESIRGNPIDGVVLLMGMRQDHPVPAHGSCVVRPPYHRPVRRSHVERQIPRQRARFRYRRVSDDREGGRRNNAAQ